MRNRLTLWHTSSWISLFLLGDESLHNNDLSLHMHSWKLSSRKTSFIGRNGPNNDDDDDEEMDGMRSPMYSDDEGGNEEEEVDV